MTSLTLSALSCAVFLAAGVIAYRTSLITVSDPALREEDADDAIGALFGWGAAGCLFSGAFGLAVSAAMVAA